MDGKRLATNNTASELDASSIAYSHCDCVGSHCQRPERSRSGMTSTILNGPGLPHNPEIASAGMANAATATCGRYPTFPMARAAPAINSPAFLRYSAMSEEAILSRKGNSVIATPLTSPVWRFLFPFLLGVVPPLDCPCRKGVGCGHGKARQPGRAAKALAIRKRARWPVGCAKRAQHI